MVILAEETNGNDKSINESVDGSVNEDGALNSSSHDPYYPPIVSLPEVEVPTGEDGEEEVFSLRSKLFRFESSADPPEWKERGTGWYNLISRSSIYRKIIPLKNCSKID